jgi:hypothetical protein
VHSQRLHGHARLFEHRLKLLLVVDVQHDEVLLVVSVGLPRQHELVQHLALVLFTVNINNKIK